MKKKELKIQRNYLNILLTEYSTCPLRADAAEVQITWIINRKQLFRNNVQKQ